MIQYSVTYLFIRGVAHRPADIHVVLQISPPNIHHCQSCWPSERQAALLRLLKSLVYIGNEFTLYLFNSISVATAAAVPTAVFLSGTFAPAKLHEAQLLVYCAAPSNIALKLAYACCHSLKT
jgi:hypothetical protein